VIKYQFITSLNLIVKAIACIKIFVSALYLWIYKCFHPIHQPVVRNAVATSRMDQTEMRSVANFNKQRMMRCPGGVGSSFVVKSGSF